MRRFLEIAFVIAIGLGLGGALAWASIQTRLGVGALSIGSWTAWPLVGSAKADPYSRAKVAVGGEVPLGAAEGVEFHARQDDAGEPLRRECQYILSGSTPPARLWTLSPYTLEGQPLERRPGSGATLAPLISRSIVRSTDGRFVATVGPRAGANNWMRVSGSGPYQLVLRVYDTQLTATGAAVQPDMPAIAFGGCPS